MVVEGTSWVKDSPVGAPKLAESHLTFSYIKTTNLLALLYLLVFLKLGRDFVSIHLSALGFT